MTGARARTPIGVATLPTTLPTTKTTAIRYDQGGYTGTIPTEFGLLTKVTELSLTENDLSGAIPTQLGYCNQMNSCFDLGWNSLSSAIPTQLGHLDQLSSGFNLYSNSLSSAIPTQLGQRLLPPIEHDLLVDSDAAWSARTDKLQLSPLFELALISDPDPGILRVRACAHALRALCGCGFGVWVSPHHATPPPHHPTTPPPHHPTTIHPATPPPHHPTNPPARTAVRAGSGSSTKANFQRAQRLTSSGRPDELRL